MISRDTTACEGAEAQLGRRIEGLTLLGAVSQMAVDAEDESALIGGAIEILRASLYPDYCKVLLLDDARGVLRQAPVSSGRELIHGTDPVPLGVGIAGEVALTGKPRLLGDSSAESNIVTGSSRLRSQACVPLMLGQKVIGVIHAGAFSGDVSSEDDERILAAVAGQLSMALGRLRAVEVARESEERFRRLSEFAFEGICFSEQGRIVDANPRLAEMLGYNPSEILGAAVTSLVAPECREVAQWRIEVGTEEPCELLAKKKNGEVFPVEIQARTVPYKGGKARFTAMWDISERARGEEQARLELRRLAALRAIDTAITSRQDLKKTLNIILDHVISQLKVDAAALFLLKEGVPPFRLAAAKGFKRNSSIGVPPVVDESWADTTTIAECLSRLGEVTKTPRLPIQSHLKNPGGFRDRCAAPLIVKGKVKGVLEVFRREPLELDREWVEFLETLAGQAAVAVDNIRLLENLQQSNADLEQAYDHIIEGWSRALELRDRETQGHAQRVAGMTVRLAKALGVPKQEWVHVRRGALLHDIGKMGIPDSILLKPGPLTEEEWVVMRRHVEYASHLLSPVEFLAPAMEIPNCHHERWDGAGYPRGLAGEAIPLAARAFSVIDTWDALSHERPYRAAWPAPQIKTFLREQSGKAFDPHVLGVFLKLRRQDVWE